MPDRGKVMSQTYYEKRSKLFKLYQEAFTRKEMNVADAVRALEMIGFGKTIAENRVNEWASEPDICIPETNKVKKNRLKQQVSLEKYMIRMKLGGKFYLRLKYKQKGLSKEETVEKLIQLSLYDKEKARKIAEYVVDGWEKER